MSAASEAVARLTRWRDDLPVAGIRFGDLTLVVADADGFRAVFEALAEVASDVDLVVDDVVASGGTLRAAAELVAEALAEVVALAVVER